MSRRTVKEKAKSEEVRGQKGVKLRATTKAQLDQMAKALGQTQAELVRRMLVFLGSIPPRVRNWALGLESLGPDEVADLMRQKEGQPGGHR